MYSFDDVIDRRNTHSLKWDATERIFGVKDVLPMWVADMDFPAPPAVIEALNKRVEHGIFGYTIIPDSLKNAVKHWLQSRHQWEIETSWLSFSTGVIPAIATAIEAFTNEEDRIVVLTPVYPPLFQLVKKHRRTLVTSSLRLAETQYEIDWNDFEEKIRGAKLLVLCSPHNPGGRVWTKEELIKIGELCVEHGVIVISDEIHADLTLPPYQHVPFASIDPAFAEKSVTCIAPTKTFNLAGLQAAAAIIPNETLKRQFNNVQQRQGILTLNTFAVAGAEAAYQHGGEWLDALLPYLQKNINRLCSYIETNLPKLRVIRPEATYLVWVDCRPLGKTERQLKQLLLEKGKIAVEFGSKFGEEGRGFIRINIACPQKTLEDALHRLTAALQ
ncbi:MalY/PatB family protein [Parageobacillus thermoglucosidasius]|uniref:MalY/PatB family protein n=1 Tax=Parageobacillus thermoglucosidasius TaxID=1426 RepID=UPI000E19B33A|nr:MalY/PatB family protein [Parageobacillus thermoglucosidasius]MED4905235.1 pyridoxal phosphate-dependent aminotransferase [Parageobacillus thermoglucosidasius]MED4914274.1 pyridoxal phosphate-dependent aminotransferase [Parageobacillus thermoglucosidasius]MED4945646.1 pyridoxal phosphate-dependent aminotransferase [Parageobacillus thermoglucosidasius]MED4981485.1 pyridoxal phosphate-dependent aminotransferase [Parageobacillus thermoglucosidasius]RDE29448.1 pyridoxal phosphate-dependent amin